MGRKLPVSFDRLPLRVYLSVFIVAIIVVVTLFLSYFSFIAAQEELVRGNEMLIRYTEKYAIESQVLVDDGLRLFDDTYNDEMQGRFPAFLAEYKRAGGDPQKMDLTAVRAGLKPLPGGTFDLYVINKSGVIVSSTVPEVLNLDFGNSFPEYYAYLSKGREGDAFFADRVVHSVVSTESGSVSGELRKFAFMPVPDHQNLLEMGLTSTAFEEQRSQLSPAAAAESLREINPNLILVRVFDANKNLLTVKGTDPAFTPDPELSATLDRTLRSSADIWVNATDDGTKVHYLLVSLPDDKTASDMNLVLELTYSNANLTRSLMWLMLYHLAIGVIAILLGILLSYVAARHIIHPIAGIIDDTGIIAQGNLNHPIRSIDIPEFRRLRESITVMIRRIRNYSAEIEKEKTELRIAAELQSDLLPKTIPPVEGFSIMAKSIPAKEIGGDFFDVLPPGTVAGSGNRTGIMIADVSGKGVPAALFMALSRIIVRVAATGYPEPSGVIATANPLISASTATGMFVTLFYGILDSGNKTLTYINAGHNPPLVLRAGTLKADELPATGIALGVLEDAPYRQESVRLCSGDIIVLYTDGITEAENSEGEMFGTERLLATVKESRDRPAGEIVENVIGAVLSFSEGRPQFDDITLMVIKVG